MRAACGPSWKPGWSWPASSAGQRVLVDSHAHLTDPGLPGTVEEVLARARASGVERVLTVGTHPADWEQALELCERHEEVLAILGLHPNHAEAAPGWLDRLRRLLDHPRVVALGEIGLDFYRRHARAEVQRAALERQLELAGERGLPVVLHVRRAFAEVLEAVRRAGLSRGVFHSFSGDGDDARAGLELGFHLSFSGPLTFSNAPELRALASRLPLERLLVETDSPYLSPHPWRGKPNEPARVRRVAEVLAEAQGVSLEETAARLTVTTEALFGLPRPGPALA